jgi:hypothetical protein
MAMPEPARPNQSWVTGRIAELRDDQSHREKINRIRQGVSDGSYQGQVATAADIDRLLAENS